MKYRSLCACAVLCVSPVAGFALPSLQQVGPVPATSPPAVVGEGIRSDCSQSIKDQRRPDAGCLQANSNATFGQLFPYPGSHNTFEAALGALVAGGRNNTAAGVESTVGGGSRNVAQGQWGTVCGGNYNAAWGIGSVVGGGGGGLPPLPNDAFGEWSVVAGGSGNAAADKWAVVGGGLGNQSGAYATVAGGVTNSASGFASTIAGGTFNKATGYASTVSGGQRNDATGWYSFAAGRRAKANEDSTFVWGDGVSRDKPSTGANTFSVYASGGVAFFTNSTATTGVTLASGAGSWSSLSDRASKENVEPVDSRSVLARVCSLPIATWNYREQDDSVRHMGPMAQEFHELFGLGVSERLIDTVDPDGVALASIQGLNAKLDELLAAKDAEIQALRARQTRLEVQVAELLLRSKGGSGEPLAAR